MQITQKERFVIGQTVTINGKVTWTVKSFATDGDVFIFRFVDTKISRRQISRKISAVMLKKVGA